MDQEEEYACKKDAEDLRTGSSYAPMPLHRKGIVLQVCLTVFVAVYLAPFILL